MKLLALIFAAFGVTLAIAGEAQPVASDPVVETRLNKISEELRCLVCQNESLAASRADLAVDLRREIRARIAKGESDESIRDFLVARYGDFVLYRPPFKATTLLLWLGPAILALAGFLALFIHLRRRARGAAQNNAQALEPVLENAALSEAERARLRELLDDAPGNRP